MGARSSGPPGHSGPPVRPAGLNVDGPVRFRERRQPCRSEYQRIPSRAGRGVRAAPRKPARSPLGVAAHRLGHRDAMTCVTGSARSGHRLVGDSSATAADAVGRRLVGPWGSARNAYRTGSVQCLRAGRCRAAADLGLSSMSMMSSRSSVGCPTDRPAATNRSTCSSPPLMPNRPGRGDQTGGLVDDLQCFHLVDAPSRCPAGPASDW